MIGTIGVCGHISTGSSAVADLLREFDESQVLNSFEFAITYFPDGLEDLEYHVMNYRKYMSSVVAISRFRKFMKSSIPKTVDNDKLNTIVNDFLNKIVHFSWNGRGNIDKYVCSQKKMLINKYAEKILRRRLFHNLYGKYMELFCYKMELSVMPDSFDEAAKDFVSGIMDLMGRDTRKDIVVFDQPFEACNPVKSFKYFDNPRAVIVDRDPRDHYLFVKLFLRARGAGYQIPCDNVENYIKYYKTIRRYPDDLNGRDDVMFMNFESLIYDYENSVKKVADFCGASNHIHKGKYFKPTHSRNNTQLFKKYKGFDKDIAKIEQELPEYLFHFENYPDIQAEGDMFWGSQSKKWR